MTAPAQDFRLPNGGNIDRSKPLRFTFDGEALLGLAGDSLASALLANGVHLVGRSFKYHRPRGILTHGSTEPNALVRLGEGEQALPNQRATEIPLFDGLVAHSQNAWPSRRHDLGALAGGAGKLLRAGFYYKTFLWPQGGWPFYERFIRRAAGLGRPPEGPDPQSQDHRHGACDCLVIGAGAAGLHAAQRAVAKGQRVILCDENPYLGGALNWITARIDGVPANAWTRKVEKELTQGGALLLANTTAFSHQDPGVCFLEQRLGPYRHRLWKITAGEVVLASGAIERPLVFPGNDRPGVMLASSVRAYIGHYGVRPGTEAVILTNNDSAYSALRDLQNAQIPVAAMVDLRKGREAPIDTGDVPFFSGAQVVESKGSKRLRGVIIQDRATGTSTEVACDLLCLSGGWTPSLHLYAQRQGKLIFNEGIGAHLPSDPQAPLRVTGAAAGEFDLQACLPDCDVLSEEAIDHDADMAAATQQATQGKAKAFVDFQNDVTASDIAQAVAEGYGDIELVKRYTTVGMGTDQGKTSNINALHLAARAAEKSPRDMGHTTFRPPYTPVLLGAIAGPATGDSLSPTRCTPFHGVSRAAGAAFVTTGTWLYPRYYPQKGEDMARSISREVRNTRENVGMVDMSSLGKIDVQGRDALAFLERVYCNNLAGLKVGRLRYSLMLRPDGLLFDDGTVARLGENHYVVTATTARSGAVWHDLEKLRQAHWPDLDVKLTSVTDHWASLAIAGPKARALLDGLAPDFDTSNEAFPMASLCLGRLGDLPARVYRVSFSGELGYEINVPAGYAPTLWHRLMAVGQPLGLMPYGLEALDIMRIEKGHISVGTEIDGRTTPADLGLARMVSAKKPFIGQALLQRRALQEKNRRQLVGLRPLDGITPLPMGAHITDAPWNGRSQESQGYLTASIESPTLGHPIALALLAGGHGRHGERVWAVSPVASQSVEAEVVSPHFFDPEGGRMRV